MKPDHGRVGEIWLYMCLMSYTLVTLAVIEAKLWYMYLGLHGVTDIAEIPIPTKFTYIPSHGPQTLCCTKENIFSSWTNRGGHCALNHAKSAQERASV